MTIQSTSATASTNGTQSTASSSSSALQAGTFTPDDFMTLLVTELKNQDPTQPVDERQMVTQLSQLQLLADVQQIGQTATQIAGQPSAAAGLLGKTVYWNDSEKGLQSGEVTAVTNTSSGWEVVAGGQTVAMSSLEAIADGSSS